jgi:hypothetical protein
MPFEQAGTVKDQRERKRYRPQGGAPPFAITRTFAASLAFRILDPSRPFVDIRFPSMDSRMGPTWRDRAS